ncbi:cytochrome P450 2D6-like [Dendronephthya gigantea]|uniref:cytochrome P450 2D6-like n=1 Tax=Dendronephthya gigantea TaxID=151771 RepID=UPI00106C3F9C|nr:cytochrome P450 2D6-like [Dendronephthya gigantea]
MFIEVAVSVFLIWVVWYISNTWIKKRGMPPGPFPLPGIGNIPQVMSNQQFPFENLSKEYGDIFTAFLPNGTFVVLNTASLARQARLATRDDVAGRSSESTYPLELIFEKDVAVSDYSPGYLFRKKVFKSSLHLFGAGIEQAEDRARHAVQLALQEIEKCESFSPNKLIPLTIFLQMWEWLTSKKLSVDDQTMYHLFNELQLIIVNQTRERSIYLLLPFLKYVSNFNRKIERAKQLRRQLLLPEYFAHRETYTPGVTRDVTDSFIAAYEKEIAKETGKDIGSMEDIPNLMLDFVVAGIDTSATTICWFLLHLVLRQEIQAKLHKEIDSVVKNDRLPCWQDAQNMPFLQATLCEVMRTSGPLPITGTTTIRDTNVAGYQIPKNATLVLNINQIHHDIREWAEPNEFKPERFLDGEGNFVGWTARHAFMPFGLGRRECLGQQLAKVTMFVFASTLLHHYKFELPEGAEKPNVLPTGLQLHRPKDFTLVAKKRY